LEKIIRDSEVETKGTVYNKSTQILAYTDDRVIVGRSIDTLEETVRNLMKASQVMGLTVNKQKTKYMEVKKKSTNIKKLKTDDQKYERVKDFKCRSHWPRGLRRRSAAVAHWRLLRQITKIIIIYVTNFKAKKKKNLLLNMPIYLLMT
jgi:hypothetical protein